MFVLSVMALPSLGRGDPFVRVSMAGRLHGSGDPYLTSVVAGPGSVIDYVIGAEMLNLGHSNSNGRGHTFSSFTFGVDGINSLALDAFELASEPVQVSFDSPAVLSGDWGAGAGASGGTLSPRSGRPSDNDLLGIRAVHSPGTFSALSGETLASGTFTVTSAGFVQPGPILRWTAGGTGLLRSNNGSETIIIDSTTESGSDPYISYANPLAVGFLPEPSSSFLLAGFGISVLIRRARPRTSGL